MKTNATKKPEPAERGAFAVAFTREPEGWVAHRLELPRGVIKKHEKAKRGPNPLAIAKFSVEHWLEKEVQQ